MINIKIGIDGKPSQERITLGNQYENVDETIVFELPEEYSEHITYIVAINKNDKTTVVLPFANNTFKVSNKITYKYGIWYIYVMMREIEIDLSVDEIDISAKGDEHVFISDGIIGVVNKSYIESELVNNIDLDPNLQIIYDDLVKLKAQLENLIQGLNDTVKEQVKIVFNEEKPNITKEITESVQSQVHDGKSAYEIAVEHGFEGTEEEWLASLDYETSEEFNSLAEQVLNNKTSVDNSMLELNKNIETINSDLQEAKQLVVNASGYASNAEQSANTAKQYSEQAKLDLSTKLDKNQGAENQGKFLKINENGEIISDNLPEQEIPSYNDIANHPSINNVELTGNKTLEELGVQPKGNYLTEVPEEYVNNTELAELLESYVKNSDLSVELNKYVSEEDLESKGYLTSESLTDLQNAIDGKLDKNLGIENANKFLMIGADGIITPVEAYTKADVDSLLQNINIEIQQIKDSISNNDNETV